MLNLFGTFNLDASNLCNVGYMEQSCGGISFSEGIITQDNGRLQAITIKTLGQYNYLFYIKEFISKKEFDARVAANENIGKSFLGETVQISVYAGSLKFPVENKEISFTNEISKTITPTTLPAIPGITQLDIEKEANLAYMIGCINGQKSEKIAFIKERNFWVTKNVFPGLPEKGKQQYPSAVFCSAFGLKYE